MKRTSERHHPDELTSVEDVAMDARHRYAYTLVEELAPPDAHLLDVGSGEGYGATMLASCVASYDGVDVSRDAVEHATARYGAPQIRFLHYDGERLPYDDDSFDVVVSFQVIEHVVDVPSYLREMHRVARPDAPVVLTTPNRLLRLRDGERPWNRFHLREYDPAGLAAVLAEVFTDVELYAIRGSDATEALERERLARARRLARMDPLGIRYVLPAPIDAALRGLLRSARRPRRHANEADVDPTLWHTKDDLDSALDLLAVARG